MGGPLAGRQVAPGACTEAHLEGGRRLHLVAVPVVLPQGPTASWAAGAATPADAATLRRVEPAREGALATRPTTQTVGLKTTVAQPFEVAPAVPGARAEPPSRGRKAAVAPPGGPGAACVLVVRARPEGVPEGSGGAPGARAMERPSWSLGPRAQEGGTGQAQKKVVARFLRPGVRASVARRAVPPVPTIPVAAHLGMDPAVVPG